MKTIETIERIFGTNPFKEGQPFPHNLTLEQLGIFLRDNQSPQLHPAQQKAILPIAVAITVRANEERIGREIGRPHTIQKLIIERYINETLHDKRKLDITDIELLRAIQFARQLDPKKDKFELQRLGDLTDQYLAIIRNRVILPVV